MLGNPFSSAGRFGPLLERLLTSIIGEPHAETWRQNVLEMGLKLCVVLGSIVYVPSVYLSVQYEKWVVAVGDTIAIVTVVLLSRVRSPGYQFRAVAFSLVLYVLGLALLLEVGPICQIYLFGFSIIATLLLGTRVGIFAVALNTISLLIIGLAGYASPEMAVSWQPQMAVGWVVTSMNFALVDTVLVVSLGVVLTALERIARRERETRDQLEREHATLAATNAALDQQVRERQSLESRLAHTQRMEMVGRLAGGVAHDFNNLLTVVCGCSEMLLSELPLDTPVRALVEDIVRAGQRGTALTRQLLTFSRQQILQVEVFNLNQVLLDTIKLLARLLGEDVALQTTLDQAAGCVKGDVGQVEQVVINLAVNGRDAMPRGGILTIETAAVDVPESDPLLPPDAWPGRYVRMAVSDTGTGMLPEVQARMFDPFFTTKPTGRGTGLGLATVYGIVRQSGGFLTVRSEIGVGTTVAVYLPQHEAEVTEPQPTLAPVHESSGNEMILVVEDDESVRALTIAVLKRQGYRVEAAESGAAALATCDRMPTAFDLVLTDVVMPGMSGRELAESLVARFPRLRVAFLSGYTSDAILRHGVEDDRVAFLQKPYTPDALVRFVRGVLDAAACGLSLESQVDKY